MPRAKKTWLQADYWATSKTVEVAQTVFSECNAIGIEIDDGILPEGKRKFLDDRILVRAYFEEKPGVHDEIISAMSRFFTECGFPVENITFTELKEEDWQGNFVRSCTTFLATPEIYIVPSFEIAEFKKHPLGELYIEMDPENAFGTGQHQTTRLCLKNIHELLASFPVDKLANLHCLDVGTGSGILAILMKKLHAANVLATETDSDALETANKNAEKNGVKFSTLLVTEEHVYENDHYDVVVANILAPVLIAMADNLFGALKKSGDIILSGILLEQASDVIAAYKKLGAQFVKQENMDDWCALVFRKA